MTANIQLRDWWEMQRLTLLEAPADLFGIEPQLLPHLLSSKVGRRILAQSLAKRSPELFAHPGPDDTLTEPWLTWPSADIRRAARDLGFWVLLPGISQLIDRKSVAAIRNQVGDERYQRITALGCPWSGQVSSTIATRAQTEVQAGLAERNLHRRIYRLGQHEMRAKCPESGAAERLAIVFGTEQSANSLAWLPHDAYERYWTVAVMDEHNGVANNEHD